MSAACEGASDVGVDWAEDTAGVVAAVMDDVCGGAVLVFEVCLVVV